MCGLWVEIDYCGCAICRYQYQISDTFYLLQWQLMLATLKVDEGVEEIATYIASVELFFVANCKTKAKQTATFLNLQVLTFLY